MSDLDVNRPRPMRRTGRLGALGRVVLGLVFLGIAVMWEEIEAAHWVAGLLGVPLLTVATMGVLRWGRPDARWTGPEGHLANTAIAVAILRRDDEIGCPVFSHIDAIEADRRRP